MIRTNLFPSCGTFESTLAGSSQQRFFETVKPIAPSGNAFVEGKAKILSESSPTRQ
jgi:hypothetical protein